MWGLGTCRTDEKNRDEERKGKKKEVEVEKSTTNYRVFSESP